MHLCDMLRDRKYFVFVLYCMINVPYLAANTFLFSPPSLPVSALRPRTTPTACLRACAVTENLSVTRRLMREKTKSIRVLHTSHQRASPYSHCSPASSSDGNRIRNLVCAASAPSP